MHAAQGTVYSRDVVTAPPKGRQMSRVHQGWVLQGLERKPSIQAAGTQGHGPALGELRMDMLVHTSAAFSDHVHSHIPHPPPSLLFP